MLYAKDDKCEQPGLLIVPRQYRTEILELTHDKLTGGHAGRKRTDQKIKIAGFWCRGQSKEERNYLKSCKPCQKVARVNKKDRVELMIPAIFEIMQDWNIDFAGEIYPTSSAGYIF